MNVTIIGAGVAGLCCAVELAERGADVEVLERNERLGANSCSWYAGGMLAPWCERETAEPLVAELGEESLEWWAGHFPGVVRNGSLVIAHGRDRAELTRFARRTERYQQLDRAEIGALEPDLAERFEQALLFPDEAHLDPRAALTTLSRRLEALGGRIRFGTDAAAQMRLRDREVIDCTGLAARKLLPDLRGVKGEMLVLKTTDISLSRPVRLLHPRFPLYIVPRGEGVYMVGATMIESDDTTRITARSMLELLSAAYALHPAFAEAEIIEIGTHARSAFPDNLPRIRRVDSRLYLNGLYRHGFLLAPALARRAAGVLLEHRHYPELMHEDSRERRLA
jgi:glycine oxidase